MAAVKHLSASKMSCYQACPFKFYLSYIKHEKVPTSVPLVFGREVHYMLEQFYKVNYKSEESFVNTWRYRWKKVCAGEFGYGDDPDTDEYEYELANGDKIEVILSKDIKWTLKKPMIEYFSLKKMGARILSDFYKKHVDDPKPRDIEKRFRMQWKGHTLVGVIDRIDKDIFGQNLVIDYKTDKHPPTGKAHVLHNAPQFTIYSLAFKELYGEDLDAILYYHLRSGKLYKTERYNADYEQLQRLCDHISQSIENDVFVPQYGYQCNFCDYRAPCSKYHFGKEGAMQIHEEPKNEEVEEWIWPKDQNVTVENA